MQWGQLMLVKDREVMQLRFAVPVGGKCDPYYANLMQQDLEDLICLYSASSVPDQSPAPQSLRY